jgi:polyhydroxybutyrate depolymerase
VPVATARWAAHDRCGPRPVTSRPAEGITLTAYPECANATAVELYTVAGGGHDWPGRRPGARLGRPGSDLDATGLVWAFFAAHPRA